MSNTLDIYKRTLSDLRYSIDEAIVSLFEKKKKNSIKLSEKEQFNFDNTDETVKQIMLDDNHSIVVVAEDVDTGEDIEYGLMDLPTDEMMSVYEVLFHRLNK